MSIPQNFKQEIICLSLHSQKNKCSRSCFAIIITMDQKLVNPFTDSRVTLPSTFSPRSQRRISFPSSHFEYSIHGLNHAPYPSQEEVQKRMLRKYEKELYVMDDQGHCMAEIIIDNQIAELQEPCLNFWSKMRESYSPRSIQNPFLCQDIFSKRSEPPPVQKNLVLTKKRKISVEKLQPETRREQISKLRQIVKKQKQKEEEKLKKTTFSLVDMYKAKRKQDVLRQIQSQKQKQRINSQKWLAEQVKFPLATFGNFQDFIKESSDSLNVIFNVIEPIKIDPEKEIIVNPPTIKIRNVTYYFIQLNK